MCMKAICCCRAKGYHTGGILLAALGLVKGTAGLPLRPTIGILEGASKATYSLGLLCLGRDAITGSTLRRVRAPGALMDDSMEVKATFAKNTADLAEAMRSSHGYVLMAAKQGNKMKSTIFQRSNIRVHLKTYSMPSC